MSYVIYSSILVKIIAYVPTAFSLIFQLTSFKTSLKIGLRTCKNEFKGITLLIGSRLLKI